MKLTDKIKAIGFQANCSYFHLSEAQAFGSTTALLSASFSLSGEFSCPNFIVRHFKVLTARGESIELPV
jgi:hypothetical protein